MKYYLVTFMMSASVDMTIRARNGTSAAVLSRFGGSGVITPEASANGLISCTSAVNGAAVWAFAELTEQGAANWVFPANALFMPGKIFNGEISYVSPTVWKYPPNGIARAIFRSKYYGATDYETLDLLGTFDGYSPSLWIVVRSDSPSPDDIPSDYPGLYSKSNAFLGLADDLPSRPVRVFMGGGNLAYAPLGMEVATPPVVPTPPVEIPPTAVTGAISDVAPLVSTLSAQIVDLRALTVSLLQEVATLNAKADQSLETITSLKSNLYSINDNVVAVGDATMQATAKESEVKTMSRMLGMSVLANVLVKK